MNLRTVIVLSALALASGLGCRVASVECDGPECGCRAPGDCACFAAVNCNATCNSGEACVLGCKDSAKCDVSAEGYAPTLTCDSDSRCLGKVGTGSKLKCNNNAGCDLTLADQAAIDCNNAAKCNVTTGANATLRCTSSSRCTATMGAAADVRCHNGANCELRFGAGSKIQCTDGVGCDATCEGNDCKMECLNGARCRLTCKGTGCEITRCDQKKDKCGDTASVCNRSC